ncbi:MAG: hypothetical protein O3C63_05770 [Cyanobacteria bacterium]|nr:hypothetical protein [Cyanobacteriota bacterium]MDA1021556.1 hypothetical protein [Cyanobacteriota bacterium]
MLKKISKVLVCCLLVFSITSCATLFGGGESSRLTVESDAPIKVKVISSEGEIVTRTTPFTVEMDRSQTYAVRLASGEYESSDIHVGKKLRGLAIANLACLLCWAIDLVTGNAFTHKKHHIFIDTKELVLKKASAIDQGKNKFTARVDVTITGTDPDEDEAMVKTHRKLEFSKV